MKSWREELLSALHTNNELYASGEELALRFGCSRAAIWKKITTLRKEGYPIEASTNRGYRIRRPAAEFERKLRIEMEKHQLTSLFRIFVTDATPSTNNLAREAGSRGEKENSVFIAMKQTSGRGRHGRTWVSDTDDGLWFSLLIRPDMEAKTSSVLTLLFGLCMIEAITSLCSLPLGIKWPNDIISLRNGKKLCGILSETSVEENRVSYAVIGCGINVSQNEFPDEIADIATSIRLEGEEIKKEALLSAFLTRVAIRYKEFLMKPGAFLSEYRANCATLGRAVRIESAEPFEGIAKDISDTGDLLVEKSDGTTITCTSGEVRVRGMLGYL
jgi:BirA family biotin operon repressor/biotin-[acetyl-CoA-carboxylase] ligase